MWRFVFEAEDIFEKYIKNIKPMDRSYEIPHKVSEAIDFPPDLQLALNQIEVQVCHLYFIIYTPGTNFIDNYTYHNMLYLSVSMQNLLTFCIQNKLHYWPAALVDNTKFDVLHFHNLVSVLAQERFVMMTDFVSYWFSGRIFLWLVDTDLLRVSDRTGQS